MWRCLEEKTSVVNSLDRGSVDDKLNTERRYWNPPSFSPGKIRSRMSFKDFESVKTTDIDELKKKQTQDQILSRSGVENDHLTIPLTSPTLNSVSGGWHLMAKSLYGSSLRLDQLRAFPMSKTEKEPPLPVTNEPQKSDESSSEFAHPHKEILKKWMEDRSRWDNSRQDYETKLNIAEENFCEQKAKAAAMLRDLKLGRKSPSAQEKEKLESAMNKVLDLESKLEIVTVRKHRLQKQCDELQKNNHDCPENPNESLEIIASLKNTLATLEMNISEYKKNERPLLTQKLDKAQKKLRALEENVCKQEERQADIKRDIQLETKRNKNREVTILRLKNEIDVLKLEDQELQFSVGAAEKMKERNENNADVLGKIRIENVKLRNLNKCLAKKSKLLEQEIHCMKNQLTFQSSDDLKVSLSPHVNSLKTNFSKHSQGILKPRKRKKHKSATQFMRKSNQRQAEVSPQSSETSTIIPYSRLQPSNCSPNSLSQSPSTSLPAKPAQFYQSDVAFIKALRQLLTESKFSSFNASHKGNAKGSKRNKAVEKSFGPNNKVKSKKKLVKDKKIKNTGSNSLLHIQIPKIRSISRPVLSSR